MKYHRDNNIVRTNIQENRCIFNQIRHIQVIGKIIISIPKKPPKPYRIGDVINTPLKYDWHDSIFSNN